MLIISLFLPFVPEGKSLIISTLLKSPLGDLGAEMSEIDFSEQTQIWKNYEIVRIRDTRIHKSMRATVKLPRETPKLGVSTYTFHQLWPHLYQNAIFFKEKREKALLYRIFTISL